MGVTHQFPPYPQHVLVTTQLFLSILLFCSQELEPYGDVKAKVKLTVLDRLKGEKDGKYVIVAGKNLTWLIFQYLKVSTAAFTDTCLHEQMKRGEKTRD